MTFVCFARCNLKLHRGQGHVSPRYGSVRNSRVAVLPKLQRMIILRCISIAKSPGTFASEIPPILNSHRACGRLCLRCAEPRIKLQGNSLLYPPPSRASFSNRGPRPSVAIRNSAEARIRCFSRVRLPLPGRKKKGWRVLASVFTRLLLRHIDSKTKPERYLLPGTVLFPTMLSWIIERAARTRRDIAATEPVNIYFIFLDTFRLPPISGRSRKISVCKASTKCL